MEAQKTEVRIVAGTLRGRKITCIVHEGLRPTPQMVREALFSILGNAVPGRQFFDIFAGTGAIGMEAISRGATSTTFLERDSKLATEIQTYLHKFGIESQCQVLRVDVYRWAERWIPTKDQPVNLFFSPPFVDLTEQCEQFIKTVRILMEKAPMESVITIQAEDGFAMDQLPEIEKWDVRKYGRNLLLFWVKEPAVPPEETATETTT